VNGHEPRRFKRGFGVVAKAVMRDRTIGVPARTLYALLATYADDDGLCLPSNETLAHDLGTSARTVQRLLSELAAHGILEREERFVEGRQTTSQTYLTDLTSWRGDAGVALGDDVSVALGDDASVVQNNTTRINTTKNNFSSNADAPDTDPTRLDVERLCKQLADRVESNGLPRPSVGKRWRDSARLLLDRDGYTEEQVRWMIDWATNDEFWRINIRSMSKLREQFGRLLLQSGAAQRRAQPSTSGAGPVIDMTPDVR
jgi:hypothetical protein